jgi:beta propeller repeat protein
MKDKLTTVPAVTLAIVVVALAFGVASAHATQVVPPRHAVPTTKASVGRPDLAGNNLVWAAKTGADWNVFYAAGLSSPGMALTTDPADQIAPRVSVSDDGHVLVVWEDHRAGNADIYGYDVTAGKGFVVCDQAAQQVAPRISGDWVVWQDDRNGNWDIYGATIDTTTDTAGPAAAICDEVHDQTQPDVSGDTVVWVDSRYGDEDIMAFDRVADATFAVCLNDAVQDQPVVWGDTVVWRDARNAATSGADIYDFSLLTSRESAVCTATGDQSAPAIDHDLVVWTDARSAKTKPDVRGYDLTLQEPFAVAVGKGGQSRPTVSGDQVVWVDARTGVGHLWTVALTPWDAGMVIDGGQAWTRTTTAHLALRARSKNGVVVRMTLGPTGSAGTVYPFWPTQKLLLSPGDGLKELTVVFTDLSGLSSPAMNASVTLDTHGPRVRVPAKVKIASGATGAIAFRVTDNLSPTASVTLRVLNAHGDVAKAFYAAHLATGTLHRYKFVCNLKPGTYQVRVRATDLAGNHQVKVAAGTLTFS